MTINLITFASILHKQVTIRSSHEAVLSELEKYFRFSYPLAGFLKISAKFFFIQRF